MLRVLAWIGAVKRPEDLYWFCFILVNYQICQVIVSFTIFIKAEIPEERLPIKGEFSPFHGQIRIIHSIPVILLQEQVMQEQVASTNL